MLAKKSSMSMRENWNLPLLESINSCDVLPFTHLTQPSALIHRRSPRFNDDTRSTPFLIPSLFLRMIRDCGRSRPPTSTPKARRSLLGHSESSRAQHARSTSRKESFSRISTCPWTSNRSTQLDLHPSRVVHFRSDTRLPRSRVKHIVDSSLIESGQTVIARPSDTRAENATATRFVPTQSSIATLACLATPSRLTITFDLLRCDDSNISSLLFNNRMSEEPDECSDVGAPL